ncbi:uncharacterized protein GGS22DRAFT_165776 [Annulohypoxylon maeteangense]|uniref:uncharacterized protein n=1 Tax=Annulohypoxylon maeteangense TaxID=1927788 RepID=UPI0020088F62|nr:uncharacterized protein GGS22DRAFT_165776 [Annulohypoxylon maeteangense]KAI0883677.1 hypothetical protein GGS22DRAFT_165776 [Annulohypoxylon maeteangense]
MSGEATKGKMKSLELSALPRLTVPCQNRTNGASNSFLAGPHALTVDFQYLSGDGVSPCSEITASSRCSVVSLSPSLFPLPPGATPPTTAHSSCLDSPPRTSRSQKSVNSWFSPPSPPPTTPLPPTPTQMKLASLIAATNGLESIQVPAGAKIKGPAIEGPELIPSHPLEAPMTPPRTRQRSYTVDSRGFRESAVDPDAPLSPPPSSLPPPYSPGMCTPERFSNTSSIPNSRVDSTTPLVYNPTDPLGTPPRSPAAESDRKKKRRCCINLEGPTNWQTAPKRRKRKIMMTAIGAAGAALMMIVAGIAVGVYIAVTGSAAL